MLADHEWLAYHERHSIQGLVVFYSSPKNKTNDFDYLLCVRKKIRDIVAIGKIQSQNILPQNEAWTKYTTSLGASSEVEWRQQAEKVLENSQKTY